MELRIIWYVVLTMFMAKYAETCQVNEFECTYVVNCTSYIDESVVSNSFLANPYTQRRIHGVVCGASTHYEYSYYYVVELIYKEIPSSHDAGIPRAIPDYDDSAVFINIVYRLNLSYNGYRQPPIIRKMKNLAELNMSRNYLTKAILSNVHELTALTEIDLSYNNISEISVNDFNYPYKSLKNINISHNNLLNIDNDVFVMFENLQILDLSYNKINILSNYSFRNVRELSYLDLSNNRLTSLDLSLKELSQLKMINLSCNIIKNFEANEFELLNNLETLDLSINTIETINVNVFKNLILLKNLDLSYNQLVVMDSNMFSNSRSLNKIDLSYNKIKSLSINLFKNTSISTFSISANRLEGSIDKGMFEGTTVTKLDLSNQFLTAVSDYAFDSLLTLKTLILSFNFIKSLSSKCFNTLINLEHLDLSSNEITNINFDKKDLSNLKYLLLKNNQLSEIKHEHLQNLNCLEYLDISENRILYLETNSINSLHNLVHLKMNNNPLQGLLKNNSFDGMIKLKEVNMSGCAINQFEYNIFHHTGQIVTLDLSYNTINVFFINTTELVNLTTLLLNNNMLENIDSVSLNSLPKLKILNLSHNILKQIHNQSFDFLFDLQYLDISYNEKLNFSVSVLRNSPKLNTLNLSGVTSAVDLDESLISDLIVSNMTFQNISQLNLGKMNYLTSLHLSFNNISNLQMDDFTKLTALKYLDLSFNKISYIQSGVFKYSILLESLNISHNCLSSIKYGVLRGLNSLKILDLSYNNLKDLQSETFYEVKHLSKLIVDYNQIITVNVMGFSGIGLLQLSIGDNPLPCKTLVHLKQYVRIEITAIRTDERNAENVNGVTCNILNNTDTTSTNDKLKTEGIRNVTNNKRPGILQYMEDMSIEFKKSNQMLSDLANLTSKVVVDNENTNVILNNILNVLNRTITV